MEPRRVRDVMTSEVTKLKRLGQRTGLRSTRATQSARQFVGQGSDDQRGDYDHAGDSAARSRQNSDGEKDRLHAGGAAHVPVSDRTSFQSGLMPIATTDRRTPGNCAQNLAGYLRR